MAHAPQEFSMTVSFAIIQSAPASHGFKISTSGQKRRTWARRKMSPAPATLIASLTVLPMHEPNSTMTTR